MWLLSAGVQAAPVFADGAKIRLDDDEPDVNSMNEYRLACDALLKQGKQP